MNAKLMLLILSLVVDSSSLYAQSDYLESYNIFLIGPENVDVSHDIQTEYYLEKYSTLLEKIMTDRNDFEQTLQTLEKKIFDNKKNKKQIEELVAEIDLISAEINTVNRYLDIWTSQNATFSNQLFLESLLPATCYEIEGRSLTYFPDDYRLDTLGIGSHIGWNEIVEERMLDFRYELVEVEPAKEEWVQKRAERNCLSADPNDCLVWSLVETPAKMDTIVIQAPEMGCVDSFFPDESDSMCKNAIISEEKVETEMQIKLIDVLTGREIRVKTFEKVACY